MTVYKYAVSIETKSLERIDRTRRKPAARAWTPREVRESVAALVLKHGESLRQAAYKNKITERQAFDAILEHLQDEQRKAVRIALLTGRGPDGPWGIAA